MSIDHSAPSRLLDPDDDTSLPSRHDGADRTVDTLRIDSTAVDLT